MDFLAAVAGCALDPIVLAAMAFAGLLSNRWWQLGIAAAAITLVAALVGGYVARTGFDATFMPERLIGASLTAAIFRLGRLAFLWRAPLPPLPPEL